MVDTDVFSDKEILAKTLDGEAGNQGILGQHAVANVIMNRVRLKWQGETTARGVCLHRKQFSCWNNTPDNKNRARIMKETSDECLVMAELALEGKLSDLTGGADSYIVRGTPCYWAKNLTPVASIGAHDFYITK